MLASTFAQLFVCHLACITICVANAMIRDKRQFFDPMIVESVYENYYDPWMGGWGLGGWGSRWRGWGSFGGWWI
uniref:Uncharacterized protein n=1 Tax=Trichuris muris TaxID=70415 RepID=A0A5S6QYS4_TRIMR